MKRPKHRLRSVSKYLSSSISNKIIIPYLLLTIVLAAFGAFVVTGLVAGSFQERLRNQLIDAGRVVSEEVVRRERLRLEVERTVANTIGVPEALIERDYQQLDDLISPIIANTKNIDSIVVVDTQGKEVLRLQRELVSANAPVQIYKGSTANFFVWPAVAQVLSDTTGRTKEIQVARDPKSDELILYTVGPVTTSDGVVGAVLVGTYLEKELEFLHSSALADITLFDETTDVVITTFPLTKEETEELFSVFTPERYQAVITQPDTTLFDDVGGPENEYTRDQTYRVAYAPFMLRNRTYGVFSVALPTNFITDTNNRSRTNLALIFSAGVVAVFWIGYAVSRRIIQPVIQLVQTSQAIAEGDLNRRTGVRSEDEIGTLAETFDHMTGELQRLLKIQQEEASKLNAILNSIADGVIVQDAVGNILVMNPAAETILEAMGDDLSYAHLPEFRNAEGQQTSIEALSAEWLSSLTGLEFHESQRFEVGQQVLSALSAPVVTPDGEQLGTVVVLRDITREVESERLKDDFITSVSHELRTPLTAIKGYNELLRMTAADKLEAQQMQFIETIDENVIDLLKVIQQMLDLSQIEAGELGIDQEPVDLAEMLETEADTWRDKMAEKNLSFTTHTPDEPVWVEGDWDRLTTVVNNLLSNAHAYTLPGGEVKLLLKQENGHAQVDVEDTGVGISTEDQRFLFKRFFRAIHEESTFEVSGAGLGLYVSKAIIEAHKDGKIWVNTQLNKGSTFSFSLPLVDPAQSEDGKKQPVSYSKAE